MRRRVSSAPLALAVVLALASAAVAGCAGRPEADPSATPSSAAPTPAEAAPPPPVPEAISISFDGLALLLSDGTEADSVAFADGEATLEFLGEHLGSTPEGVPNEHFGHVAYDWDGVRLLVYPYDGHSFLIVSTPEAGGLTLVTVGDIAVGSTHDDVVATSPFDTGWDSDDDGDTDGFGVDARPGPPGTRSLSYPGQPGTDYVAVDLEDDVVTMIRAPFGDYRDV